MRGVIVLACAVPLISQAVVGQTKTLAPDPPPAASAVRGDSLAAVVPVGTRLLTVKAERGSRAPTTGRYVVLLGGRPFAAATAPELILGAPTVAFLSTGDPDIVLLSTYTGGQGIPGFYLKVLVLGDEGTAQAFSLSSASVGEIPSDRVLSIERPAAGQFQLSLWGGLVLTYTKGQLYAEQR